MATPELLLQLSLAGDGRLVILTPQTVRAAFFQFTKVNQYTERHKYPLNRPVYKSFKVWKDKDKFSKSKADATLLDSLYRAYLDKEKLTHLYKKDILYIEREINKQIIRKDLALVNNEGVLLEGYAICQEVGKNREKVKYIRRYGMIFIVEPIMRHTVIKSKNLDLFIQDDSFDFHLVRYRGIILSRVKLLFHHRLDFSISWTCKLEEFQPRQIFRVKKIYPCDGFKIISI